MSARDYLAAVQQRADAATEAPWRTWRDGHVGSPSVHIGGICMPTPGSDPGARMPDAEFISAARTDVPRLVAALTAALDLCDDPDELDRDAALDIRAVITAALTPKENDS